MNEDEIAYEYSAIALHQYACKSELFQYLHDPRALELHGLEPHELVNAWQKNGVTNEETPPLIYLPLQHISLLISTLLLWKYTHPVDSKIHSQHHLAC